MNGLKKESTVDASQIKSFSVERFKRRLGSLTSAELDSVLEAVMLCIGR